MQRAADNTHRAGAPIMVPVGWAPPTMSGKLCIAIRLMKQLAIPLSNQKTVAKWLVIGRQNTAAKSLVKPDLHWFWLVKLWRCGVGLAH